MTSFLRLNAWPIPAAAESPNLTPVNIGSRERSHSGAFLSDRRARLRRWQVDTPPVSELVAKAIEGVVSGIGDTWPFDGDAFSLKGSAPATARTYGFVPNVGADLDTVLLVSNRESERKFGTHGFIGGIAITNLLPANVRTGTDASADTSGFTAIDSAALASSAAFFYEQVKSLEVVTSAAVNSVKGGVQTNGVAGVASQRYVASVYVNTLNEDEDIECFLEDTANSVVGATQTLTGTVNADTWYRFVVEVTAGSGVTPSLQLTVREGVADANLTFYCDGFQIEAAQGVGKNASAWINGTAPASAVIDPSPAFFTQPGAQDFTVNAWMMLPETPTGSDIFRMDAPAFVPGAFVKFGPNTAGTIMTANMPNSLSATASIPGDNAWHMYTAVFRGDPESGENLVEVYVDGVLGTPLAGGSPVSFANASSMFLAGGSNSLGSNAYVDDLSIFPWAAPTTQILAWFNTAKALQTPRVYMDGDIMPDEELLVLVEGEISSSKFLGASDTDGTFRKNFRMLSLILEEVGV